MQTFNLQMYKAKDYNGLVTKSNLGALYMKEPHSVTNMIHQIYRTNLSSNIFDFVNQFPEIEAPEGEFYYWDLMGQHEKNIPLIDWYDASGNKPLEPGYAGAKIYLLFGEPYFERSNVIKSNKEEYQFIITAVAERGSNFEYEVELIRNSDEVSVPSEELTPGSRWVKFYNLQPNTMSFEGQKPNFTSPFRMRNIMSTLRMQYEVAGNMIGEGKNYPLKFGFPGKDGKQIPVWINYQDMVAKYQFDLAKVTSQLYGRHNFTQNDVFLNKSMVNGFKIESGAGLFNQVAPSNQLSVSGFDFDFLTEVILDLSIGRVEMGQRTVTICTGTRGMQDFHQAAVRKVGSTLTAVSRTTDFIHKGGSGIPGVQKEMSFGFMFTKVYEILGITYVLMYCPMFDNEVMFPELDPAGGTTESRRMLIMGFGGDAGIKRVKPKGFTETFGYINGLRDPFSPGGTAASPKQIVSPIDGYTVHGMWQGGIMVTDPTKIIDIRRNVG